MKSSPLWLTLAVPAALAALVAVAVPTASSAPSASTLHDRAVSATASHVKAPTIAPVKGAVHIVQRGLVKDCEYIETGDPIGGEIAGAGVNRPVILVPADTPGNCFDLYNKFTYKPGDGNTYTGYEYQNGDGHCLWDNDGTLDVGAPCKANKPTEEFYGIAYFKGGPNPGWTVGDEVGGPSFEMGGQGDCTFYEDVTMQYDEGASCILWNFPQR